MVCSGWFDLVIYIFFGYFVDKFVSNVIWGNIIDVVGVDVYYFYDKL